MYCVHPVTSDVLWLGASDRRLALFENVYPIPRGISYNAYLVLDEKTVLLDTADKAVGDRFLENLEYGLHGRNLDYVVVNHMEPDHCATLGEVLRRYPQTQVVGNAKTITMIGQFFDLDLTGRTVTVKEGDTLSTGRHTFTFVMAPMVHWPETMATYDSTDRILFSADAFGTFGALNGNLYADEVNFERDWLDDARRYYANIVGKYGAQVQALLKKAAGLDIAYICPLHGPIWRETIGWLIDKYQKWSTYEPEDRGVMIAYATIYGHTREAAEKLAQKLTDRGCPKVVLADLARADWAECVEDAFRYSKLVLASVTYNGAVFPAMRAFIESLTERGYQSRTLALMENGSWAPTSARQMKAMFDNSKNITWLPTSLKINSALHPGDDAVLDAMAAELWP